MSEPPPSAMESSPSKRSALPRPRGHSLTTPDQHIFQFRKDLQGLRTIAALLVAIFHIWGLGISGGVDVFLVLAGYFLARRYMADRHLDNAVSFHRYVTRYILHTGPQIYLLLGSLLLIGFFLLNPSDWRRLLHNILFSAIYLENFWLSALQQSYVTPEPSVLTQHLWATSLIFQAYLVWFLFARIADSVSAGRSLSCVRLITIFLSVTGTASLIWSIVWSNQDGTAAFYALSTRWWEFVVGSLVALWWRNGSEYLPPNIAALLSWVGLGLLLSGGVVVGAQPFPGSAALWPVIAASLLLIAARSDRRSNAGYVLSFGPLSDLGRYSFGFYLWHWPLLVLFCIYHGQRPSFVIGALLIVLALVLAFLFEPVDHIGREGRRRAVATAFLCLVIAVVGVDRSLKWFGPALGTSRLLFGNMADLRPGPLMTKEETLYVDQQCWTDSSEVKRCSYGSSSSRRSIYLVGGSHSAHWLPALLEFANAYNFVVVTMLKPNCMFGAPTDVTLYAMHTDAVSCGLWNENVLTSILADRPSLVVTLATRPVFQSAQERKGIIGEHVPDGYVDYFRKLAAENIRVLAIRDTPWLPKDPSHCLALFRFWRESSCNEPRKVLFNDIAVNQDLDKLPGNVAYLDMTDAFCSFTVCFPMKDGIRIYSDRSHIMPAYTRHISSVFSKRITKLLPERIRENEVLPAFGR